jgi:phosphoserine phosphatase
MQPFTIIWDFDGTLLPLEPFDSEQSLLLHRMSRAENPLGWFKKGYARAIIYADRREWFRKTFKTSYIRLLRGTPSSAFDEVCRCLAEKISAADRQTLRQLKTDGHDMMVLSCGTADLSERILGFAGLIDCFSQIEGNRFQIDEDRIAGMHLRLADPDDKLKLAKKLNLSGRQTIVVGDGYTDLPLLRWSAIPVIIDRAGRKKKEFASQNFYFIKSVPEIMNIIKQLRHTYNGRINE